MSFEDIEGRVEICSSCQVNRVPSDLLEEGLCGDCHVDEAMSPVPLDFERDKGMSRSAPVVTYRDIDQEYDDYDE